MPHVACQTDDLCDVIPSLIRYAMAYETQYNDPRGVAVEITDSVLWYYLIKAINQTC